MIAEYTLKGTMKAVGQAAVQARNPTNNFTNYRQKHFGSQLNPTADMLRQLDWLRHICNQAFAGFSQSEKDFMFCSMASAYILKFIWIFNNDAEAKQDFLALPEIHNLISSQIQLGNALAVRCAQTDVVCS